MLCIRFEGMDREMGRNWEEEIGEGVAVVFRKVWRRKMGRCIENVCEAWGKGKEDRQRNGEWGERLKGVLNCFVTILKRLG